MVLLDDGVLRVHRLVNVAWDDWKQGGHEIHSRRCATVFRVHYIFMEVRKFLNFNGMGLIIDFVDDVDLKIAETRQDTLTICHLLRDADKVVGSSLQPSLSVGNNQIHIGMLIQVIRGLLD